MDRGIAPRNDFAIKPDGTIAIIKRNETFSHINGILLEIWAYALTHFKLTAYSAESIPQSSRGYPLKGVDGMGENSGLIGVKHYMCGVGLSPIHSIAFLLPGDVNELDARTDRQAGRALGGRT